MVQRTVDLERDSCHVMRFKQSRCAFFQINLTTKDLLMHGFCEQISSSSPWQSSWGTFTLLGTFSLVLVTGAVGDTLPSMLHRDEHDVHSVQLQVFSFRLAVETYRSDKYLANVLSCISYTILRNFMTLGNPRPSVASFLVHVQCTW